MSFDQIDPENIPQHVAIIMDGNGRWAQKNRLMRIEGHRKGVQRVQEICDVAGDLGIQYLTLYAFSVENWNRPKDEVDALMQLLYRFLKSQRKQLIKKQIRLETIGRTQELPQFVYEQLQETIDMTASFSRQCLCLALNYGARTEIVDAFQAYQQAVQSGDENADDCSWDILSKYLYTGSMPDPDLIIRTSGEQRISNFLLLQSAYAEYYFHPGAWPDFEEKQFMEAILSYQKRERRFGKTSQQISHYSENKM